MDILDTRENLNHMVLKHEQQIKDLAAHLLELEQSMFRPGMEFKPEDIVLCCNPGLSLTTEFKPEDIVLCCKPGLGQTTASEPDEPGVRCAVKDCENWKSQGLFYGLLCSPCHHFVCGKGGVYSQAYRNTRALVNAAVDAERELAKRPTKIFGPNLVGMLNAAGFRRKKDWVCLTDEDKLEIKKSVTYNQFDTAGEYANRVQAATEAKLKEKNT